MEKVHWVRSNGFVLAMIGAVAVAFVLPGPGARGGFLHPDFVTNFGIALILFLQGLALPFEKFKQGASNWRLHLLIQTFTFLIFPIVGVLFHWLIPMLWPAEPEGIRNGFLYLCVLPSTVSTSIVLTAAARGNVAGALFNAALSNLMGVFLTPALVQLLMHSAGQTQSFWPLLQKIILLTLVPFFAGLALRPAVKKWVDAHKKWIGRTCNAVIVFIVYSAFCDSVTEKIWQRHGLRMTALVFLFVAVLFALMSGLIALALQFVRLNREDRITAYFCAVKKTLAMGVPLAALIFGASPDLPMILLPLMFYHPLQLLVNGVLANHWALHGAETRTIRTSPPAPEPLAPDSQLSQTKP